MRVSPTGPNRISLGPADVHVALPRLQSTRTARRPPGSKWSVYFDPSSGVSTVPSPPSKRTSCQVVLGRTSFGTSAVTSRVASPDVAHATNAAARNAAVGRRSAITIGNAILRTKSREHRSERERGGPARALFTSPPRADAQTDDDRHSDRPGDDRRQYEREDEIARQVGFEERCPVDDELDRNPDEHEHG